MSSAVLTRAALVLGLAVFIAPSAAVAQEIEPEEQTDPRAQDPEWHARQQLYLLELTAADGWHVEEGGLRWRWLDYRASNDKPTVADRVTVHYEGKLIDGAVFDSSYARGQPATFGLGGLIPGWQIAIPKIGVGEAIEVAIPSHLAYGPEGRGPIPPNATLIFKVELVDIQR